MVSAPTTEILAALASGQTLLTANERAARTLRNAYNRHQQSAGATLWTPPEIYSVETFLSALHHRLTLDGLETRLLLNRSQEHALWRTHIAADSSVSGLRSVDSLAELAAAAWRLLLLHNGRGRLRDFNVSTDTRAFQRWAEAFDRTCIRHSYLTAAALPAALTQGHLPIPKAGLTLVDFDTLTPAHATLIDSIREAGYPVEILHTTVQSTVSLTSSFYDPEGLATSFDDAAELRAAALWSTDLLANDPTATIAIVVPNLADRRPQLDRVFSELLPPQCFEFSLGQPLADTAPVAAALDLLRWPLEPLQLPAISTLLLSPFFAATDPELALAAAEFDAFELRRANLLRPELSLESMIQLVLRARRAERLKPLLNRLRSLNATASEAGSQNSHALWADHFRALLEAAGWTAATGRDSLAFQTQRRWESALDELSTLDFEGASLSAAEALRTLTRIARQAIFAPESRYAPVQILGPLEPGGIPFDALWFLSADDQSWPQPASGSPLIPWHIQRDLGIPGCNPVSDTAVAQSLTNRLAHSATTVVFSYSRHGEDGVRHPSPLLQTVDLVPFVSGPQPHTTVAFDEFPDTEPIPPLSPGVTAGGARILELQAACSFRAFAEIRLHSSEPDAKELGLDARDRGIHVHKIMQTFWGHLGTQKALRELPIPDRTDLLDHCIEIAIARAASAAHTPWEDAYLDVQRRRLRALLLPWLEFELTRPEFTVRQQEEKRTVEIGPLTLELRADRIDETQGGPLILDYKTGSATPSQWLGERPDAPQLPLYAVLSEDATQLGGVAFALLRPGEELALKGFADSPTVLDNPTRRKLTATLADQLEDWHRILTDLAVAFAESDPIAAPKKYPQTCERCTQRILCRLDPTTLDATEDDEQEALDA